LRVFFTNQRLSVNDKFLKEVQLYHPDAFDLYLSFIFVYHTLRVRNEAGSLSSMEATLLSDLRQNYPESGLPVPGTVVDNLQTMTTTENPYPWLGNITVVPPEVTEFRSPSVAYQLENDRHLFWPNFKFLISQLIATAARARPTDNNWNTLHGIRFTSPGAAAANTTAVAAIRTDSTERFWLRTPHGRVPNVLNLRVAQAFHDAILGSNNAPFYSEFALDLPHMNDITSTANGTLASYMGLIDDEGVTSRNVRYRRWPTQLAPMVGTACKYISGSRYLSDIPVTGLGALHHISRLTASSHLEIRDPADVQGGNAAVINAATYQAFYFDNLDATLNVRDPVASDLSIQYEMLTQVNINLQDALDGEGQALGNLGNLRQGAFWDYAIGENGPTSSVSNIILSHLPNFIKSVPRRDHNE